MSTYRIPEWAIATALAGVLALGAVDLYMLRRHSIAPPPRPGADTIGLHADADGDAVRLQWNRRGRTIVNADHAVLYISDGSSERMVELNGEQLDRANVVYYPQNQHVSFRMDVYRGRLSLTDTTSSELGHPRRTREPGRVAFERVRPSPFEQVQPEIVVTQRRPVPVVLHTVETQPDVAANHQPGSFERVLGKIPLLRRLSSHRERE